MEFSKMIEQAAQYLGASQKIPEIGSPMETEKIVGTADEVLGRIPRPEELRQELQSIEKEMARETEESLKQAEKIKSSDLPESPKKTKI
jgi:rRNA processing protein Gar1